MDTSLKLFLLFIISLENLFIYAMPVNNISIITIHPINESQKIVCQSKRCLRSAAKFLAAMDTTVDPCDDFYKYACGNWGKYHKNPENDSSYDSDTEKQNKVDKVVSDILTTNSSEDDPLPLVQARDMYKACMDSDSSMTFKMKTIIDLIKSVGLDPLPKSLNLTNSHSKIDCIETIVKIKKKLNMDMLFKFQFTSDTSNHKPQLLHLGLVDYSMSDIEKNINTTDEDNNSDDQFEARMHIFKNKTMRVVNDVIKLVPEYSKKKISQKTLVRNVNKTITDFMRLAKNVSEIWNEFYTSIDDSTYNTVYRLQNKTDKVLKSSNLTSIDVWKKYIRLLFDNTNVTINFDKDLIKIYESDINALNKIMVVVQNISNEQMESFIWFQLFGQLKQFTELYSNETYNRTERHEYCKQMVLSNIGKAVVYNHIQKTFSISSLHKSNVMVKNIKDELKIAIESADWMDSATIMKATEKIDAMESVMGFPDWLLDAKKLEDYYQGVHINKTNHILNQIMFLELNFLKKLNSYRLPVIQHDKMTDKEYLLTTVNAYADPLTNTIVIPYVSIQDPSFNLGFDALDYGALGFTLGHEISHHIDDIGRSYDMHGDENNWWSSSTSNHYDEKSQCLIQQFSDVYIREIDEYIDGNGTLGENLADNIGLPLALKAYRKVKKGIEILPGLEHLNGDQLFFLTHANGWCETNTNKSLSEQWNDSHAPGFARINENLKNSPDFAKVWNCKLASCMNPRRERCIMF